MSVVRPLFGLSKKGTLSTCLSTPSVCLGPELVLLSVRLDVYPSSASPGRQTLYPGAKHTTPGPDERTRDSGWNRLFKIPLQTLVEDSVVSPQSKG